MSENEHDATAYFLQKDGVYVIRDGKPAERIDSDLNLPSRYDDRDFGGDYEPEDERRFHNDLDRVRWFFFNHPRKWYSKEEVRVGADLPPGKDVTPRIRDLRKEQYGDLQIVVRKVGGQYRYRYEPLDE